MTRREIREEIFKLLFEKELTDNNVEKRIEETIKENNIRKEEHIEFLKSYINDIIANEDILIEKIKEILDGWTYERLGTLEKVLLKVSFYEITIKEVGYEIAINEVAKDFLTSQEIIKNSKIKSYPSGKAVVVEAVVDTYNVDNLKDKLSKIQEKLSEHVFNSTGITVKKSKVNLKKVLGETIVEKKIIDEPADNKEKNLETTISEEKNTDQQEGEN